MSELYKRGVYVTEGTTETIKNYDITECSIPFIVGCAPINMAENALVNRCVLINSLADFRSKFGSSENFEEYNLCEIADAIYNMQTEATAIFVNVLDPEIHKKTVDVKLERNNSIAVIPQTGIIKESLVLEGIDMQDYTLSYNEEGYLKISFLSEEATQKVQTIENVTVDILDPSKVTDIEIIGNYDVSNGKRTGLQLVNACMPQTGVVPAYIVIPGYSSEPVIAIAMEAASQDINGIFEAIPIYDLDCMNYTSVNDIPNAVAALKVRKGIAVWLMPEINGRIYHGSSVKTAVTMRVDAINGNVPWSSTSNVSLNITTTRLGDGTEYVLDREQANNVVAHGGYTFLNNFGWRTWGNNLLVYPNHTDAKDRWETIRRMLNWWKLRFVRQYIDYIDAPMGASQIESIIEAEQELIDAYVANKYIVGGNVSYEDADNPEEDIVEGILRFRISLGFHIPNERIESTILFDPNILLEALTGKSEQVSTRNGSLEEVW